MELPRHFPNERSLGPIRSHLGVAKGPESAFFCCRPYRDSVVARTSGSEARTVNDKPAERERVLTGSTPGDLIEFGQFRWGSWFSFRKFRLNNQFPCERGRCNLRSSASGPDTPQPALRGVLAPARVRWHFKFSWYVSVFLLPWEFSKFCC